MARSWILRVNTVKITNTEIKWLIISKSVMIIIFVEFIDQLIDFPIIRASLKKYVVSAYGSSTSSVKHHNETHIIENAGMKQSKWLNCDLKPEHKKTKNRITMSMTTGIDSQARTTWNRLAMTPSFCLRTNLPFCNLSRKQSIQP